MAAAFGELVRGHRRRLGWTQETLTERSGVSVHTISLLEAGRRPPRLSSAAAIADALGLCPPDRERLLAAAGADTPTAPSPPASDAPGAAEAQSARAVPRMLPYAVHDFTGRHHEVDRLLAAAGGLGGQPGGTVVISAIDGMAGIGKTALAVHVGHALADRFPDGQIFVDLHGFTPGQSPLDPEAALTRLLRAVGVDKLPAGTEELAQMWRSEAADRRLLVVLDNAADTAQVRPLIPAGSGCLVLVTSRRRMPALTGAAGLSLDLLSEDEARELFASIVGSERLVGQSEQVDAITELCGRLPLAVRIAATRLAHRPAWRAADLLARLRTQHRLLSELAVEDLNLASAFAVSYDCLNPEQKQAFRLAGLHPGDDFTATDIAALSGAPLDVAEELLDELYYQHLIIERRAGRFVFHDLLLHHAREAAVTDESGEARAAALDRLLDHYTYAAAKAMDLLYPHEHHRRPQPKEPEAPLVAFSEVADARAWLDAEAANLVAGGVHAHETGAYEPCRDLSAILFRYLDASDRLQDAMDLHGAAIEAARALGDDAGQAAALTNLAGAHWRLGNWSQAIELYEPALGLYRAVDDSAGQARVLTNLGVTYTQVGRTAEAVEHQIQALAVFEQTGDQASQVVALNNLSRIYERMGNLTDALERQRQCLDLAREVGDRYNEGRSLQNIGATLIRMNRYAEARVSLEKSLALTREIGHRSGTATCLNHLGECDLAEYPQRALAYHEEALAIAADIGERFGVALAHLGIGDAHRALGDVGTARWHWQDALTAFEAIGATEAADAQRRLADTEASGG